ncbi:hypothetical protein GCM10027059_26180 [Myceligenerans halotolerans]
MTRRADTYSTASVLVLGGCLLALLGWQFAGTFTALWVVVP